MLKFIAILKCKGQHQSVREESQIEEAYEMTPPAGARAGGCGLVLWLNAELLYCMWHAVRKTLHSGVKAALFK